MVNGQVEKRMYSGMLWYKTKAFEGISKKWPGSRKEGLIQGWSNTRSGSQLDIPQLLPSLASWPPPAKQRSNHGFFPAQMFCGGAFFWCWPKFLVTWSSFDGLAQFPINYEAFNLKKRLSNLILRTNIALNIYALHKSQPIRCSLDQRLPWEQSVRAALCGDTSASSHFLEEMIVHLNQL